MIKGGGGFRFSTRSQYAIVVLVDLAFSGKGNVRSVNDIATSWDLSPKYINQLVIPLRKKGYIQSLPGVNGGYLLEMSPQSIRVIDIVDLMDGQFGLCSNVVEPNSCPQSDSCKPFPFWFLISQKMRGVLADLTLKDLIRAYSAPSAKAEPKRKSNKGRQ